MSGAVRHRRGRWSSTSLLFFFSSRRRHTRLQGDWSSDVCSSDLLLNASAACCINELILLYVLGIMTDRKSVVQGKSVDLGGRRIIKKKKKEETLTTDTKKQTSQQ